MFDISWTEFLLIGIVALVVIGPKELPGVMRSLGQWTRKIRGMATEFQNQFQEAMREAEMADLKKQVDDMAQGVKDDFTKLDPLKDVRADVESIGKDIDKDLNKTLADTAFPLGETMTPVEPQPAVLAEASAPEAAAALATEVPPTQVAASEVTEAPLDLQNNTVSDAAPETAPDAKAETPAPANPGRAE
jgi:sec-independent protein translocase protein TatB